MPKRDERDWKICPDCRTPMLPIDGAPEASWGCAVCGEAWTVDEALEPDAKERRKLGFDSRS